MPIHIIGEKSFVLPDVPSVDYNPDKEAEAKLLEVQKVLDETFAGSKYLVVIESADGKRSHYMAGDADGKPLRMDAAQKMLHRLSIRLSFGR